MQRAPMLMMLLCIATLGASAPPAPVRFAVPRVDIAMDLHGNPARAQLVIFAGGNEWFALPAVIAAFQRSHPEVRRVFYETLPPGVLAQQMHAGELQMGELRIDVQPDVFMSGKRRMEAEVHDGF